MTRLTNKLNVEGHDNRGDETYAYGFVYFTDGRRVTYTGTDVRDGTGGWPAITDEHKALATGYLRALELPPYERPESVHETT